MANTTPKAILHRKYGSKAVYKIEEMKEPAGTGCPGLVPIHQQFRTLYRCYLELPEFSVTSDVFPKKKDAEQAAAKLAIDKLGIQPRTTNYNAHEAQAEMISRLSYLFSDEFISSSHPIASHFKESYKRGIMHRGRIPVSVLSACDTKIVSLCKIMDPTSESDPFSNLALVMKAASCSDFLEMSETKLWLWKKIPDSKEVSESLVCDDALPVETIVLEALHIPSSAAKPIEELSIDIAPQNYYMDVIAQNLGAKDCSELLITRNIGKSSSEMRVYYVLPDKSGMDLNSPKESLPLTIDLMKLETFNARASYLSGQTIFGDAIMATIGYTWRSTHIIQEPVSLGTYYRMLFGRAPHGNYKLSREALLSSELPVSLSTFSHWRGMLPRDLLNNFCRQHKLSEPVFSTKCLHPSSERADKTKMRKSVNESECESEMETNAAGIDNSHMHGSFTCEVKILTRSGGILVESTSKDYYRRQNDAINSIALRIINWLAAYFKELDMPLDRISDSGNAYGLRVYAESFYEELMLCRIVHGEHLRDLSRENCLLTKPIIREEEEITSVDSPDVNMFPTAGSFVSISYSVILLRECDGKVSECLEKNNDFEFEIGSGAVFNELEACVSQLVVNQTACFTTQCPSRYLIIAASDKISKSTYWQSPEDCVLEYQVKLLRVTQPLEDRIEQALFSPPLSKQRVGYALRHIQDSSSTSLVDFGCGSGSLLIALLEQPSSLQKMVGVDLSQKSLSRGAKILHSKLSKDQESTKNSCLRSFVLYDGSITDFDSRIFGFDIGTCLEVIEHMEEEQAHLFGDVVLSRFCPRVLIVSTPNYEYNALLQGTSNKDEDTEDKEPSLRFKFRNHDHKFEWTRQQFENWATSLASKHDYTVEFSGVRGKANVEPGFASQIAVFKCKTVSKMENDDTRADDWSQPYKVLWEWLSEDLST